MTKRKINSDVRERFGPLAPDFVRYTEEVLFGDLLNDQTLAPRERIS